MTVIAQVVLSLHSALIEIKGLAVLTGDFKFERGHGFDGYKDVPYTKSKLSPYKALVLDVQENTVRESAHG